jgi:hypothetical protein
MNSRTHYAWQHHMSSKTIRLCHKHLRKLQGHELALRTQLQVYHPCPLQLYHPVISLLQEPSTLVTCDAHEQTVLHMPHELLEEPSAQQQIHTVAAEIQSVSHTHMCHVQAITPAALHS